MVSLLFTIETPKTRLIWQQITATPPLHGVAMGGTLRIQADPMAGILLMPLPEGLNHTPLNTVLPGPPLYEQTTYRLSLQGQVGQTVEIRHEDPDIQTHFGPLDHSQPHWVMGEINFRSQVGLTGFEVWVDGHQAYRLELEVFPTKLAYKEDFQHMLADVQDVLMGLVFQYLSATYHHAESHPHPQATDLEWVILFQHILADLEKALRQIARQPIRGLQQQPHWQRGAKIKRVTTSLRKMVRQSKGKGPWQQLNNTMSLHDQLLIQQPHYTLNTPEHRWLAFQIQRLRQKLSRIKAIEQNRFYAQPRHIAQLEQWEHQLVHLQQLEPFAQVTKPPAAHFCSLQLLSSSGYREAYRALLILQLGLGLANNGLKLSLKDVATLYEYWCYLSMVRLLSGICQNPPHWQDFIAIQQGGLQVRLQRGETSRTRFCYGKTHIELLYNPKLQQNALLFHQPDMLLEVKHPQWPMVRAVIDAKYRLDMNEPTLKQHGIPAPPEDALNVLHRYRDAILHEDSLLPETEAASLARSVLQGVALYPYTLQEPQEYRQSRLFHVFQQLGIGAIPCVPTQTEPLQSWLHSFVSGHPWQLAHTSFPSVLQPALRQAATEGVLIGTLRSKNPQQHLDWVQQTNSYYIPAINPAHGRQWRLHWIALYLPKSLQNGQGAVTLRGKVDGIESMPRSDLSTPWPSRIKGSILRYHVAHWEPIRPIYNATNGHIQNRWTTRLGLECAQNTNELLLETISEWQLYESLQREGQAFRIMAGRIPQLDEDTPGHAVFELASGQQIVSQGAGGFTLVYHGTTARYAGLTALMRALRDK